MVDQWPRYSQVLGQEEAVKPEAITAELTAPTAINLLLLPWGGLNQIPVITMLFQVTVARSKWHCEMVKDQCEGVGE